MLALNGLPRPHHPLFGTKSFSRVTDDRFFLCIESTDPMFDASKTRAFLESVGAETVEEVAP
jgi:prephenate dehydrogenase